MFLCKLTRAFETTWSPAARQPASLWSVWRAFPGWPAAQEPASCWAPPVLSPLTPCLLGVFVTQTSSQVAFLAGKRARRPTHDRCLFCDFGYKLTSWGAE